MLTSALVGTLRTGERPEALLDAVAAHALRRRAGVALVNGVPLAPPAPLDDTPVLGPAAAARADALLALDSAARDALPVRDAAARVELLAEWLTAAAQTGRRLPAELVPALLDAGRRYPQLRPLIRPVAGPLADWLAAQRAHWSYVLRSTITESTVDASQSTGADSESAAGAGQFGVAAQSAGADGESTVDDTVCRLGSIEQRVAYLTRLRGRDPAQARTLLAAAWPILPPDERAALLEALSIGLTNDDEPLLEDALNDRRKQVRDAALTLLAHLSDSRHAARMADRLRACVDFPELGRIRVNPPTACDASMRRDGITARPPAGVGERAWWLEEIVARTPLRCWPAPEVVLASEVSDAWASALRRGLARAAATQRHGAWANALVDPLTAAVRAHRDPVDRRLLEALYAVLPDDHLAARATAMLRGGLAEAAALGVEHVLARCPRPWPPGVSAAVLDALDERLAHRGGDWWFTSICELAALRLPAQAAGRVQELVEHLRTARPVDPRLVVAERLAATLAFRRDMLEELR